MLHCLVAHVEELLLPIRREKERGACVGSGSAASNPTEKKMRIHEDKNKKGKKNTKQKRNYVRQKVHLIKAKKVKGTPTNGV